MSYVEMLCNCFFVRLFLDTTLLFSIRDCSLQCRQRDVPETRVCLHVTRAYSCVTWKNKNVHGNKNIKAIDRTFYLFTGVITCGMLGEHWKSFSVGEWLQNFRKTFSSLSPWVSELAFPIDSSSVCLRLLDAYTSFRGRCSVTMVIWIKRALKLPGERRTNFVKFF